MKIFYESEMSEINKKAEEKFGKWVVERADLSDEQVKKELK